VNSTVNYESLVAKYYTKLEEFLGIPEEKQINVIEIMSQSIDAATEIDSKTVTPGKIINLMKEYKSKPSAGSLYKICSDATITATETDSGVSFDAEYALKEMELNCVNWDPKNDEYGAWCSSVITYLHSWADVLLRCQSKDYTRRTLEFAFKALSFKYVCKMYQNIIDLFV